MGPKPRLAELKAAEKNARVDLANTQEAQVPLPHNTIYHLGSSLPGLAALSLILGGDEETGSPGWRRAWPNVPNGPPA